MEILISKRIPFRNGPSRTSIAILFISTCIISRLPTRSVDQDMMSENTTTRSLTPVALAVGTKNGHLSRNLAGEVVVARRASARLSFILLTSEDHLYWHAPRHSNTYHLWELSGDRTTRLASGNKVSPEDSLIRLQPLLKR